MTECEVSEINSISLGICFLKQKTDFACRHWLGQGDNKAMVSAWLWCKNPSGCRHRKVEVTPDLMKDNGHAIAMHSEAFGAGQHWDPHAQLDLKGNPVAHPESGLVVTRCAGGYSRERGK